jgi:hypothetical protein
VLCDRFAALNLSFCGIGPHGADFVAQALLSGRKRMSVASVNLDGNRIASLVCWVPGLA